MTIEQFGATVKQKYSQYSSYSDSEVGSKMLEKYPQYQNKVVPAGQYNVAPIQQPILTSQQKIEKYKTEQVGFYTAAKKANSPLGFMSNFGKAVVENIAPSEVGLGKTIGKIGSSKNLDIYLNNINILSDTNLKLRKIIADKEARGEDASYQKRIYNDNFKIISDNKNEIDNYAKDLPSEKQAIGQLLGTAIDLLSFGTYGKATAAMSSFKLMSNVRPSILPSASQKFLSKETAKEVVGGGAIGYGFDVAQNLQDANNENPFTPGLGTTIGLGIPVIGRGAPALRNVVKSQEAKQKAINELEQKYSEWMSGTTPGKKKVDKLGAKTDALNRAGTEGQTPMRVLAEDGVIPNRQGTKLDTFEQAKQYREKITPFREANRSALKELEASTPPVSLNELEAKSIARARTPENINSGKATDMEKQIRKEFDKLRAEYPSGNIPITVVDDIKTARWDNVFKNKSLVEADALAKNSEYAIAKAFQKEIENIAAKSGNVDVAQLNREIGSRLDAAKYLEDLNGKTIKGGRLLKYVTTAIGSSMGQSLAGKFIGALGGNLVGELIIANNVASPLKRMILKNLQAKDPAAYTKTIEWLSKQKLDQETRLLIGAPEGKTPIPLGGETFIGPKVGPDGKPIILKQGGANIIPAQKNPVSVNPSTGKFQTSYSSSNQSKSPTSQQTKPATTKVANISIKDIIPRGIPKVNIPKAVKVPNGPKGNAMDIGLEVRGIEKWAEKDVLKILKDEFNIVPENKKFYKKTPDGEATLSLSYKNRISDETMFRISKRFEQEAIPQYSNGTGKLHGPGNTNPAWGGGYSHEYFKGKELLKESVSIIPKKKVNNAQPTNSAKEAVAKGLTEEQYVKLQQLTQTLRGTKGMTSDQIQKQYPNIRLTKEVVAKDVYGNTVKIPDGKKLTPYEMKDGKIVLQDGQTYVVSKNQFANIKGNTVGGEAKPFAPELDGTEETVKGTNVNPDGTLKGKDNPPKYHYYQLPDGKNYKEVLIKAPVERTQTLPDFIAEYKKRFPTSPLSDKEIGAFHKEGLNVPKIGKSTSEPAGFKSSHWDEPNVISHLRLNERTYKGKKVTFMEELQSDWAREGRKKGFTSDVALSWEKAAGNDDIHAVSGDGKKITITPEGSKFYVYEDGGRLGQTSDTLDGAKKIAQNYIGNGIPNNPLLKNWQQTSVKRALKEAVDNDSEYFAWINGEQTSARYSLATKVEKVDWGGADIKDGKFVNRNVTITPLEGKSVIKINVDNNGVIKEASRGSDWNGKKLDEVLGKGLADKIMADESGKLSGDGLKFGGEWANTLYDKQVGNIVKDLTGAKIEMMDMGLPIDKATTLKVFKSGSAPKDMTIADIKVGNQVYKGNTDSPFIITDVLGDGKFKAVPKDIYERAKEQVKIRMQGNENPDFNFTMDNVPNFTSKTETFDISTKTTIQQGIQLTPEIKAMIRGEALDIKTSGKQFEDNSSQLRTEYADELAKSKPKNILESIKQKYKDTPNKQGGVISTGFKDNGLTTKVLQKLEGRTSVSKQFISDLTNSGDLRQAERDLIRSVLKDMPDNVNVTEFANKVKTELLPLKTMNPKREQIGGRSGGYRYESIALPDDLRGNVADYSERIYQSPIKTSAGDVHFSSIKPSEREGYFAHTRVEDMAQESMKPFNAKDYPKLSNAEIGKKIKEHNFQQSNTRRVIEIQSDLFQKGGLENEFKNIATPKEVMDTFGANNMKKNSIGEFSYKEALQGAKDKSQLEPYRNTWHERIIREEIKQAAKDGKTKLQFPTGETAMKVEGLGEAASWAMREESGTTLTLTKDILDQVDKKRFLGTEVFPISEAGDSWIITDILGDGKFKAVPKELYVDVTKKKYIAVVLDRMKRATETFDISGKVDTNNPIYKFYEKDVQKFLNKFGGKQIVDDQGVSWIEVPITKQMGKDPIQAFGNIRLGPLFAGAAIGAAAVAITTPSKQTYKANPIPQKKENPKQREDKMKKFNSLVVTK